MASLPSQIRRNANVRRHAGNLARAVAIPIILMSAARGQELEASAASLPSYMTERDGATNPDAISSSAAMWVFFNLVSSLEAQQPSQGKELVLKSGIGLDDQTAGKVVTLISRSMRDDQKFGRATLTRLCKETKAQQLSSEALALKLVAAEQAGIKHRDKYFAQLDQSLDEHSKQLLELWVEGNVQSTTRIVEADYVQMFTEGGVDGHALMASACAKSSAVSDGKN